MGYTALDSDSLKSSVFREGPMVWAVWTAILADKNKDGFTSLTPGFLAHQWSVKESEVQKAWDVLAGPDKSSKNPECEGRRIIPGEDHGEWYVVSHDFYRSKWSTQRRKEANRIAQKRARLKKDGKLCHFKACVNPTYGAGDKFCPEHAFEEDE